MKRRTKHQPTASLFVALAGHAYRASGNEEKVAQYDNLFTDFVNLVIAEAKAKMSLESAKEEE